MSKDYKRQHFYRERYLCTVLDDMRTCDKTKNYGALAGLIEEAQMMGNDMESAISMQKSIPKLRREYDKVRKAYKKLVKEYETLLAEVKPLRAKSKNKK